jgi:hypothetical protein
VKESPNITANWMPIPIHYYNHCFFFFFQALNFLVESSGLSTTSFHFPQSWTQAILMIAITEAKTCS